MLSKNIMYLKNYFPNNKNIIKDTFRVYLGLNSPQLVCVKTFLSYFKT